LGRPPIADDTLEVRGRRQENHNYPYD